MKKTIKEYKVVYNTCYGGFGLSKEACEYLNEKYNMGINVQYGYLPDDVERHDSRVIEVVELMKDKADGFCAKLKIIKIDAPMYRIDDYDGLESVETPDSYDWIIIGE